MGSITLLALILSLPFLRELFKFRTLHTMDFAIAIGACIIGVIAYEMIKKFVRYKDNFY